MGKSNIAVKQMFRNKARFADLFNGVIFQGTQLIRPDDLEEIDSESSIILNDKKNITKGIQKYRDVTMRWKKGASFSILAIENQNKIHYAMPVRTMLYDSLSYTDQLHLLWDNRQIDQKITSEEFLSNFCKGDHLSPIISLVFYYGLKPWDASTDLYGLFQCNELLQTAPILKRYIPNYHINLIDAGNIESLNYFHTDLQLILGVLQYKDRTDELQKFIRKHKYYFENVDVRTYQALKELLHSERKMKAVIQKTEQGERVNMCKALDDLYNSGIEQGIERGIYALVKTCKEFNLSQEDILERITKEFSITKETASKYLN